MSTIESTGGAPGTRWRRVWWGLSVVALLALSYAGHMWSDQLWIEAHARATAEWLAGDAEGPVVVARTFQMGLADGVAAGASVLALLVAFVPLLRRLGGGACGFARGYLAQSGPNDGRR